VFLNIIVIFTLKRYNWNIFEGRCDIMAISYNKLWKLLIDKKMKKKDLQHLSGVSSATITKLGRDENVNTEILQKICTALNCNIGDIMEFVPNTDKEENLKNE